MKSSSKIVSVKSLQAKIKAHKRSGKRIAFTNGCFDILHWGHVSYLEKAKGHDRVLIVALNSDASVRKLKGKGRPVNNERSRAHVLAALACVDYVTVFSEPTPLSLIKRLKPDILIKGADWKDKPVAGADVVQRSGGRVQFIEFLDGYSTSSILRSCLRR
jgi:D-beta-D-heptose 7-phosphate kinase/D-beta-D-heptose 1-phosphate adenosyltransferase